MHIHQVLTIIFNVFAGSNHHFRALDSTIDEVVSETLDPLMTGANNGKLLTARIE